MSTGEAAELLQVSEASVRRLSDQGALPVRRVGGRRERRFRAEDVSGFARGKRALVPAREIDLTQVLVGGVPIRPGTHLAPIYDSDAGRLRLSLPFLVEGLRSAQPCYLIAHGAVLDVYLDALSLEVDVEEARATGLLSIADSPGTTTAEALQFWEEKAWAALSGGAGVIRAVGEMSAERERFVSEQEMLAYEAAMHFTTSRFPIVCLCQYDARAFSGVALTAALKAHPDQFGHHLGRFLN